MKSSVALLEEASSELVNLMSCMLRQRSGTEAHRQQSHFEESGIVRLDEPWLGTTVLHIRNQ
jgi:hypothetical protein